MISNFGWVFIITVLFLIFFVTIISDISCFSKRSYKENVEKHNLLISCGFDCYYNTSIRQYVWTKDERMFFDDDLKYLTLKELEEIVK